MVHKQSSTPPGLSLGEGIPQVREVKTGVLISGLQATGQPREHRSVP